MNLDAESPDTDYYQLLPPITRAWNSTHPSTSPSRTGAFSRSRLIRSRRPVSTAPVDKSSYLAGVVSAVPSLHDISVCQNLFANEANFACESACDIFEVRADGKGYWARSLNDEKIGSYIGSLPHRGYIRPVGNLENVKLRAIFCTIREHAGTSFGHQLSISRDASKKLLAAFDITPHFCPLMLGETDYWAPLHLPIRNGSVTEQIAFLCQYPRYNFRIRQQTCSVYMGYDPTNACTTYLVVSGEQEPYVERTKARLDEYFSPASSPSFPASRPEIEDPFLLHSILCHESLVHGKKIITKLRSRLYAELDRVALYADEPFDRSALKGVTNRLHMISQNADSLLANAKMGATLVQLMLRAREQTSLAVPNSFPNSTVGDALVYILESLATQKRWLSSYKSRKDTAMNLVFNLVTQQDSKTSADIARDTKNDSASMKVIAAMTMLFLPTTAISGAFSMCFFTVDAATGLEVSRKVWLSVACAVPLTLLIVLLWWAWYPLQSVFRRCVARETSSPIPAKSTETVDLSG